MYSSLLASSTSRTTRGRHRHRPIPCHVAQHQGEPTLFPLLAPVASYLPHGRHHGLLALASGYYQLLLDGEVLPLLDVAS